MTEENACGCEVRFDPDVDMNDAGCLCPTTDIVSVIGRKYSLLLLSLIADRGVARFNEIKSELGEISSSTLSIRLAELEEAGLIERRTFAEIPPRVEYSLTGEGVTLRRGLLSLMRAASRKRSKAGS